MSPLLNYAFCPTCFGIFESRAFQNAVAKRCSEPCIFCGSTAWVDSDRGLLKGFILNTLQSSWHDALQLQEIANILQKLAEGTIDEVQAAHAIDAVSPGAGQRILTQIKAHGMVIIPIMTTAITLFLAWQANTIAQDSNRIAEEAIDHAKQQAVQEALSQEHPPSRQQHKIVKAPVSDASPHGSMAKNRKARLAEKAQKRRKGRKRN